MYFFRRAAFPINYVMESLRNQYRSVLRVSTYLSILTDFMISILGSIISYFSHSVLFGLIITWRRECVEILHGFSLYIERFRQ